MLPGSDEQERILSESRTAIKRHAFQMRKSIEEEDNLREALRYSAAMLGELRTSLLSPQKYYELYMMVFDQLVNLEVMFRSLADFSLLKKGIDKQYLGDLCFRLFSMNRETKDDLSVNSTNLCSMLGMCFQGCELMAPAHQSWAGDCYVVFGTLALRSMLNFSDRFFHNKACKDFHLCTAQNLQLLRRYRPVSCQIAATQKS
jgi:hypothetical protein